MKSFINEFFKWYETSDHKKNEDSYKDTINFEYLSKLDNDELIRFFTKFAKEGGKIQSGGQRTVVRLIENISSKITEFKNKILEPFNEEFALPDYLEWAETISFFSPGIASIYINRVNKNKFSVVNDKSIKAYKLLGYIITGNSFKERYLCISKAQNDLMSQFPSIDNYYVADAISEFLVGKDEGRDFYRDFSCKQIIAEYLEKVKNDKLDESYKWETVKYFQDNWNSDINGLSAFLEELFKRQNNLIHYLNAGTIKVFAEMYPEKFKILLAFIFDESVSLLERISYFKQTFEDIIPELEKINPKIQAKPAEAEFAFFLTCKYPDKYYLYRSNYYSRYAERIKETKKKEATEKYLHYLDLMQEFNNKYIKTNEEVQSLTSQYLEKYGLELNPSRNILTQNVIYVTMIQGRKKEDEEDEQTYDYDQNSNINYWIFQGNPKVFDYETALREEILTDWTVSAHKDKIKIGDKVILWITGRSAGCYALAEVTSEPSVKTHSPDDHLWKVENESQLKADIKITHNLINNPILKTDLESINTLRSMKVGNQGTNFSATKEQYEAMLKMTEDKDTKKYWLYSPGNNAEFWDEYYEAGIMAIGWDKLGDLNNYLSKEEIVNRLKEIDRSSSSKKNDATANWEFKNTINVGDIIITKRGRSEYLGYGVVNSDYYYDDEKDEYKHRRKLEWKSKGVWKEDNFKIVVKTLTDITKYPDYVERLKELLGIEEERPSKKAELNMPLNTILYGPPGTGKTYKLKEEYFDKFTRHQSTVTKKEFTINKIKDLSWWQVIALALLDMGKSKVSEISNHQFIEIKNNHSNTSSLVPTIWGQLQSHTIEECEHVNIKKRSIVQIFNKTRDSEWELLEEKVNEQAPELIRIKEEIDNYQPKSEKKKRYVFTTFHQSFSYEDFIEGIKPVVIENEDNPELGKQLIYEIKPGIFKQIVEAAKKDPYNNYAIFIDEINRGNIAKIFGELITLIETDKRIDCDNYIPAKLPYSNEEFGVPANLYIIGTMNTADRSVEAIDTALRRRFAFEEINPQPELLSQDKFKCEGIDLEALLTAINSRIEKLLDKDYCIGHSYFMTVKNRENPLNELRDIFRNRVNPLLQEYFYGDWGKIMLVLGNEFIEKKIEKIKFLAAEEYEDLDQYDEKPVYSFTYSESWDMNSFRSIYE